MLAALSCFFFTLIGTIVGLRSADPASLDLVAAAGGGSWRQLRTVRSRASLPSVFAALRIAAPTALLGAMIGEYLGGDSGLGVAMVNAQRSVQVTRTWGIAVVAAADRRRGLRRHGARRSTAHALGAEVRSMTAVRLTLDPARDPGRGRGRRSVVGPVVRALGSAALSIVSVLGAWQLFLWAFDVDPFVGRTPADVWTYLVTAPGAAAHRQALVDASLDHAARRGPRTGGWGVVGA